MQELWDLGSIPGWEDPLEEGLATHSSILDWRIPWTKEAGGLQSLRSRRVGCDWSSTQAWFPIEHSLASARGSVQENCRVWSICCLVHLETQQPCPPSCSVSCRTWGIAPPWEHHQTLMCPGFARTHHVPLHGWLWASAPLQIERTLCGPEPPSWITSQTVCWPEPPGTQTVLSGGAFLGSEWSAPRSPGQRLISFCWGWFFPTRVGGVLLSHQQPAHNPEPGPPAPVSSGRRRPILGAFPPQTHSIFS